MGMLSAKASVTKLERALAPMPDRHGFEVPAGYQASAIFPLVELE